MASVLTTGSIIDCGHGGTAILNSSAKLEINGMPVLLDSEAMNLALTKTPCAQQPNAGTPCTAILSIAVGKSGKLTVNGAAVLLDTLGGTTLGGTPDNTSLGAVSQQNKLEAV